VEQRPQPDDTPGALRPTGEIDQLGELDLRCALPILAVLLNRLVPEVFEPEGVEDCAVDLAIRATDDSAPDVPRSTGGNEVLCATR